MGERKLFKTKLCVLYQRGHCPRQSCSFAHGDAELRRFSGSFDGRRDYRGSDLRGKLDRRRSPIRRYSPVRDARGRHTLRGYSPTSSLGKRSLYPSDRKRRKKQQLDGQSDFSGSLRVSDDTEDGSRDKKLASSDSKGVLEEQLRQVQSDIDSLNNGKCQLEMYLEESVQEVDCLTSRIQELEMQLCQEKEECKRITSKIKKFVKAHNRYSRLQDEVKRSHDRLQKLGDQLGAEVTRPDANEEDSSINILSDGETNGNKLQKDASPKQKRLRMNVEAAEELKSTNLMKGEGTLLGTIKLGKHSRRNVQNVQSNNNREVELEDNGSNNHRIQAIEDRPKQGGIVFTNVLSAEKFKGSEPDFLLPPTSIAAHAVDDVLETNEVDDLNIVGTAAATIEKGSKHGFQGLPFLPPPPPVPPNAYTQYRGEDENVDVEALEEEMVDVDIV
ncbi:Zinc finger CCCH domain-containing protein [Actinidia chinensis var. chinensis]|uniref:Zinc finger CCCH domain-containing protein n=1 Tax=Actinidia chinensis var. chinensis TaxID=1590841 RepID=A0A2R6QCF0_ACTCC|nr:Zinc finger CCCH domain-containing protein [Actinidia chinensis var. chinensis]